MSSYEYNQLLKFLYFEGYADSYAEAEELLESMSDEEFEDLLERKYDKDEKLPSGKTPSEKMYRKHAQHGARVFLGNPALGRHRRKDPERDSYRERAHTMDTVKDAQDAGEEPRNSSAWKNTIAARRRPRASYEVPNERPGGLRAKATKAGGYRTLTRKEELEMQEAWHSGAGSYRTTASGRKVRRDEDEATDTAVSDMLQKQREAAAKKAARARLAAKGNLPIRKPKQNEEFESYVENLQNEGYDLSNWTWDGIEEFYIDEAKKEFPSDAVKRQSAKHMRNFLTRPNSAVGQRSKQKSKKMDAIRSTVEVGDDPRNTMHGQDLRKIREDFDIIVEFLFVEGYADTIESAELMAESISAEWVDEIMEKFDPKDYKEYHQNNHRDKRNPSDEWDAQEKDWQDSRGDIRDKHTQARGVKKKRGSKDVNEKYVRAMDTTGRGADRRAHTTDPTVRPIRRKPTPEKYKHSEAEFDSTLTSPGARKRKTERRQAVGGKSYTEAYEVIVDYLYSEGYANTIQFAELMAENISEDWMNEILEAYVELSATKKDAMTNRANKLLNKDDWNKANKIEKARTHDPEASKAKERANRERR